MIYLKGIIYVVVSAVLFGCVPLLAKSIYQLGGNPINLTFHRFVLALPVLFMLMLKYSSSICISKKELYKIFVLSFGFAGTPILLLSSYNYISSGTSTTIHFVYPIFVILGCIIIFHEKISLIKCICTILCTSGILLFYTPNQQGSFIGIVIAFISGITYAFYIIYLDKSGLKSMPSFKLAFYLSAVSAVELFIFSLATNTLTFDIEPLGWVLTFIFSILISIGATVLFQTGVKIIGSQHAAIFSTFEPLTSIIIGVLVFNEILNLKIIIGIILILTSVILLSIFDKGNSKSFEN